MNKLKPIEKTSTSMKVQMSIREAIFTRQLEPGTKITLQDLAKQLGVSVTPVREAMLILQQEQLVEMMPHKETVILGVDRSYIYDYYHYRAVLEAYVVDVICSENRDIKAIEAAYKRMDENIQRGNYEMFKDDNRNFHNELWKAADNRFIEKTLTSLWVNNSASINATIMDNAISSHKEHQALMKKIRERDAENAKTLMFDHIIRSMNDIMTHYPA